MILRPHVEVLVLCGLVLCGCEQAAPVVPVVPVVPVDAAGAAEPAVIARCAQLVLTVDDYEDALEYMRLYRPFQPDVLGSPRFQQGTVVNLVDIRLMRAAAHERGIAATPEEVAAHIASDPRLAGAPVERARVVAADAVLNRRLTEALVTAPTDDAVWNAWRAHTERVEIEFVAVPNTPSSNAITAFVEGHGDEIERHFREHPGKFRLPESRRVRILEMTGPDARNALAGHRVQVLAGADFAALARIHSVHATAAQGGDLGWVVRRQRPEAFAVEVGDVTEPFVTKVGQAVALVVEALPERPQALTGSVRREIAADLLRAAGPDAGAAELAADIRAAWTGDDVDALLRPHGLRRQPSLPFEDARPDVFVPGIGREPAVLAAVRTLVDSGDVAGPVFARGHHYVVRLVRRGKATRTAFAAERAEFAESLTARRKAAAVPTLLEARRRACGLELDLRPIAARYGRTVKPGQ